MKGGGETSPLGDVCHILDSKRKPITKRDRVEGPYPYYGATGVLDHVASYLFDEALVLIGEDGAKWAAGDRSAFAISGKTWVNNHAHVLRPERSKVLDDWLIYFLNFTDLSDFVSGMTVPKLNQGRLREIKIPCPPLEEQKRIVAILDEAFEGLHRARENAVANLQNARELFPSYLGCVSAADQEGWRNYTIGELVEKGVLDKPLDGNHGETHPKKADFVARGVPFVMASDLIDGLVDQKGCNFISRLQADKLRKGFAVNGDVLLSHKGTIGRTAMLVTELDYVMLTPQVTYYRVLDKDQLEPEFLYYSFQGVPFQLEISNAAKDGATRAYIGITRQLDLTISMPNISIQRGLVLRFRDFETMAAGCAASYEAQIKALDALRQSLLHKAFAGELT